MSGPLKYNCFAGTSCGACLVSAPYWSRDRGRWIHNSGLDCYAKVADDGVPLGPCCHGHEDGSLAAYEQCVEQDADQD